MKVGRPEKTCTTGLFLQDSELRGLQEQEQEQLGFMMSQFDLRAGVYGRGFPDPQSRRHAFGDE
jgi:hypothetical protein